MTTHDNGLPAGAYAPLADVDPPVVTHVLDLLHSAGVAAYAEPFEGERGPYADVRTPSRPTLRVYVDRDRVVEARDLVAARLPGLRADFLADVAARDDRRELAEAEVEAAWAAIVAGYGEAPPAPAEGAEAPGQPQGQRPGGSGLSSRLIRRADEPWGTAAQAHDQGDPDDPDALDDGDDPVEHYVPPPPPPLPRPDTVSRFAWAGLLGGPLLLVLAAMFHLSLDRWFVYLAMAATAGGFITLVVRMKDRAPQDDGWDDGAVV